MFVTIRTRIESPRYRPPLSGSTPARLVRQDRTRPVRSSRGVGQELLQAKRVADGEDLPVVVEVREDLHVGAPPSQPAGPLAELGLAVVPAPAAGAVVEADERPRRCEAVRLERLDIRPVGDH